MNQNPIENFEESPIVGGFLRKALLRHLKKLRCGEVVISDGEHRWQFGSPSEDGLRATIDVHSQAFYKRVVRGGELGLAESLLRGEWSCDDLASLIRIFVRDAETTESFQRKASKLRRFVSRLKHWLRRNTLANAKANIHQHYDLGNEFFGKFLDETMSYSCALFKSSQSTLKEASLEKIRRACRQLNLGPDDHLLEIGSGWGEFAVVASTEFGCRVTTATISEEQYRATQEKFRDRGVSGAEVILEDYRQITGQFDKIVSIEMIEAVGHQYFQTYFDKCAALLTPTGKMLLQAIVIRDSKYKAYIRDVDFIRAYIFPGGCLPSVGVMSGAASKAGLRLVSLEDFTPHYAETLRRWQSTFLENRAEIAAMGFDERFLRMWDFYLRYCEAAFEERQVNLVQSVFAKRECVSAASYGRIPGSAEPSDMTVDVTRYQLH